MLVTHTALKRVVDIIDLHDRTTLFEDRRSIYSDLHPLFNFGITCIDLFAVSLDQTDTAR